MRGKAHTLTPARVVSRPQDRIHRPIVLAFPGQGSQYVNMAAGLYRSQPVFRNELDRCAALLQSHLSRPLLAVIFPAGSRIDAAVELLDRTEFPQPALFSIEYALARWWITLGLEPQAMIGHSVGEYVAACLSGVFRLEDALAVVAFRGRVMEALPEGAMLAVTLAEPDVTPFLDGNLCLAAVNGPAQCVISGPRADADRCEGALVSHGVVVRRLPASRAFHSAMTAPAAAELEAFLQRLPLAPPRIPYVSNVTGTWATAEDATNPAYWARQLRQTVRFADGLDAVLAIHDALIVEAGLARPYGLARWHPAKSSSQVVVSSLPARDPGRQLSRAAIGGERCACGSRGELGTCMMGNAAASHCRRTRSSGSASGSNREARPRRRPTMTRARPRWTTGSTFPPGRDRPRRVCAIDSTWREPAGSS